MCFNRFRCFIWSSGLPIIDHLLHKWDFLSLATARSIIGGIFLTIISIIDGEKANCLEGSKEWIWSDRITITCGSIFADNQADKFFNNIIQLKNPYDKGNAVFDVSSMPNTLSPGINYIMLSKDEKRLQVTTLLQYNGNLLEIITEY